MVRLVPMDEAEFARYLEGAVKEYAQAHIKAGDCDPEDALALAQADYDGLLPHGLATKNHHLLSIRDDDARPIGMIWFEFREKRGKRSAYIYNFNILPEYRRKGYGSKTLQALESLVAAMGVARISLNVMGWNQSAQALYEKAGYGVTGIGMNKWLSQTASTEDLP